MIRDSTGDRDSRSRDQSGYEIRFDWGLRGLEALAEAADVFVIVDVLSFSTCVDVAVSRGAIVLPYPWADDSADGYAAEKHALLASKRRRFEGTYSLAPSSLGEIPAATRLVLPSPNGSELAFRAAAHGAVFCGCLRNPRAVSSAASRHGQTIAVIAAGERWDDLTLRPALEDLLGAGAIIHALQGNRSPEAEAAQAVFLRFQHSLDATLARCASGRELVARGFAADLRLAAALGVSPTAPILVDREFHRAE
jgi:2-phosphosulfolactate phosphatase